MISIDEARARVLAAARPLGHEHVPLANAVGRILAADIAAAWDLPTYDNAAMDGFAIRVADVAQASDEATVHLRVVGQAYAGSPSTCPVGPGQTVLVTTGATMPAGADAVVRQEAVGRDGQSIIVRGPVTAGENLRRRGEAAEKGHVVLRDRTLIGPTEIGVLATFGVHEVLVREKPRVHIVPTGDELESVEHAGPDHPVDSNRPMIRALAEQAGAWVEHVPIVRDDADALAQALDEASKVANLITTIGGASVGGRDLVRPTLARLGGRELFWGVAIRPGKPVGGAQLGRALVLALPGNPAACRTTFELLARPAIAALAGAPVGKPVRAKAVIAGTVQQKPDLTSFVRGTAVLTSAGLRVTPTQRLRSGQVLPWLGTNALLVVPPGRGALTSGDTVEVELDGPLEVEHGAGADEHH